MVLTNTLLTSLFFQVVCSHFLESLRYDQKIVGGQKTKITEYPFLVSIKKNRLTQWETVCGGTILNGYWVLTAAHCFSDDPVKGSIFPASMYQVHAGATLSYDTTAGQLYQVTKVEMLGFKKAKIDGLTTYFDDIALISLEEKLDFSKTVQPIRIPTPQVFKFFQPWEIFPDPCTTIGWGLLNENDPKAAVNALRAVNLSIISNNQCRQMEPKLKLLDTQLCTHDAEGKRDACFGDSGGPLLCGGIQVGIVSFGEGCARPHRANMWTRVDKYYDWIKRKAGHVVNVKSMPFVHSKNGKVITFAWPWVGILILGWFLAL